VIDSATRAFVLQRASNRCEYCKLPQQGYEATFNVDHIIASQHRQDDHPGNLALSCPKCNRKKGPNLAGIDPATQSLVPLFHPRNEIWADHFVWHGLILTGLTPTGRATIALLDLNGEDRIRLRRALAAEGMFGE
jgi:hypothetical protein